MKREPVEIEPFEREKVDLEFKAPEKPEKPEKPIEEIEKPAYVRELKETPDDEVDATELTIPKVEVSNQMLETVVICGVFFIC